MVTSENNYLIWLIVGVSASRRASLAMGIIASSLDAPNARYVSVLSRFSLSSFIVNSAQIARVWRKEQGYVLELFQDVGDGDGDAGKCCAAEHANDRN